MKSDVETVSPTRVKLTVDLPFEELAPHLDAAYKRIAAQVTVPGFRKGKVPARVIDQRFGRAVVLEEAVSEAVPAAFDAAVKENDLKPIGSPDFDVQELNDGESLAFTVEVDVRPEFDLPDLDSFRVEVDSAEPSDEEVAEQLDSLRTRFATLTDVERPAQDGDVLLVDLAGACEGEDVEDLSASALSFELGGAEEPIPGFDEAVRGAVADEVRTFSFPAEAGQYEGKDIDVTVTVSKVRERELPEADDDFALMASEFDTIDELTADIRDPAGADEADRAGRPGPDPACTRRSWTPWSSRCPSRCCRRRSSSTSRTVTATTSTVPSSRSRHEAASSPRSCSTGSPRPRRSRWPRRSSPPGSCSSPSATG